MKVNVYDHKESWIEHFHHIKVSETDRQLTVGDYSENKTVVVY